MTVSTADRGLVRLDASGCDVYVWPEGPDWFVPNARAAFLLERLLRGEAHSRVAEDYARSTALSLGEASAQVERFASRLDHPDPAPYAGRQARLKLGRLRELWLHVTNRCNARCTHCMFRSSPSDASHLPTDRALALADEAARLGCELFYFTGGEPLVHEGFPDLCEHLLSQTGAHIVVLTNAILAERLLPKLAGWDRERVHFQVSVDGSEASHDAVRGPGSYRRLLGDAARLVDAGFPVALAMAVQRRNVADMPALVDLAVRLGVRNLHYLWLFARGNATADQFVPPEEIYPHLVAAAEAAEAAGVLIDNVEILKSQVFSLPGTRFDLSNAGWESLAVGPDGQVYPSPALIGKAEAACGDARDGLERAWRKSPVLESLRAASIASTPAWLANPLAWLVGGGDVDHSLVHGGAFTGHDPYVPLYNRMALWIIAREAARFPEADAPGFRLRMGDWLYKCGEEAGVTPGDGLFFTHSNCVLSLPGKDGRSPVRDFYARAAASPNAEIQNPVGYAEEEVAFIPREARVRSYGCGSPVLDARLREGETVVDLGCGAGVECFIASSHVGRTGRVIGIDMLPAMLERARRAAAKVAGRLGYRNVVFRQALLEELPLPDGAADAVVSNCVLNLSPQKRRAFHEMLRILKPGGRIVISDVASADDIPLDIQYSEKLRGECLGGAFREDRLFQLLADVGFRHATLLKRFPYRKVRGHQFYSLTYSAVKPRAEPPRRVIYRGPFAAVVTEEGRLLERGRAVPMAWQDGSALGDSVFVLDDAGNVLNVEQGAACSCSAAPEEGPGAAACCCGSETAEAEAPAPKHRADCMVCGAPLEYLAEEREETCHFCGQRKAANALCEAGHFVCDACHSRDALAVIESVLTGSTETDMVALLKRVRRHQAIPVHGPEHHSLVPGIVVAAYRNSGGEVSPGAIGAAVRRGATVAGGSCGFLGICGAATGVGSAFSLLLGANPLEGTQRQVVQQVTAKVLAEIARLDAPRCCQRDCWLGLRVAAELSRDILPIPLTADEPLACEQAALNRECIGSECPLWAKGLDNGGDS